MGEGTLSPRALYRFFNSRYFRGRLPDIPVVWVPDEKIPGRVGEAWFDGPEPTRIQLNSRYRHARVYWIMTLLHEMVHVEQAKLPKSQTHGRKFQKRMKHLAAIGAFNNFW